MPELTLPNGVVLTAHLGDGAYYAKANGYYWFAAERDGEWHYVALDAPALDSFFTMEGITVRREGDDDGGVAREAAHHSRH